MDQLKRLKLLLGIADAAQDDLLLALLDIARQKLLDRIYPFDCTADLPDRYAMKQVEIAIFLYNKRGAEGQTAHSENGISRSYGGADVPEDLLKSITAHACVI